VTVWRKQEGADDVLQKREKEREERRRDLGVIVDVPREPTAEEVEAVKRG
jgi:hypothetical protein